MGNILLFNQYISLTALVTSYFYIKNVLHSEGLKVDTDDHLSTSHITNPDVWHAKVKSILLALELFQLILSHSISVSLIFT